MIRTLLAGHILKPVLFRDEIENIHAAGGMIFIEFGPKNILTNLVDNILAGKPHFAIALKCQCEKRQRPAVPRGGDCAACCWPGAEGHRSLCC